MERSFLTGLCGYNSNGTFCYEGFVEITDIICTVAVCSNDLEECNCTALSGVEMLGCCIDVVDDFITLVEVVNGFGNYNLDEIYGNCDVTVPETGCNNSPLTATGSSSLPRASYVSTIAILLLVKLL